MTTTQRRENEDVYHKDCEEILGSIPVGAQKLVKKGYLQVRNAAQNYGSSTFSGY